MSEERKNPNFNLESCLRNKVNEAKKYLKDRHTRQKNNPCEEPSYAESFIYYFQEVETLLNLYKQEKESNEWLLKAFDESRKNNIELAHEYMEYKNSSIGKDKIREVIDEELPSIEICNICEMYDVNGVDIRKRLERLLED